MATKKREAFFTPDSLLIYAHRFLLVRALITTLTDRSGFPHGQLKTDIAVCSYHKSNDSNPVLLRTRWSYHEPPDNFEELIRVYVWNLGSLGDKDDLKQAGELLAEWNTYSSSWCRTQREVICMEPPVTQSVSFHEEHILQNMVRFQSAIAATIAIGHEYQNYLCGLVNGIGSFIATKNRENEERKGLIIRTPADY